MTKQDHGGFSLLQLATDLRVMLTAAGIVAGGTGVKVFGDAGVTAAESRIIADSVSRAYTAPINQKVDELTSILVEAFPEVKKVAQDRARKNADSREVTEVLTGER